MTATAATTATTATMRDGTGRADAALAGTWTLIRFILRRDRVRIPVWVVSIAGFLLLTAASLPDLYRTAEERQARADLMRNPATTALAGPGHGLDDYTFGAMLTNEMLGFTAIVVALMSVFLVVRHTRTEEETGRAELVRAAVVGRHATVTAALAVVVGVNLLLGLVIVVGLAALGIESVTWEGSLLFGAALASVGVVFAAVAAVAAQVTEHARGASGLAGVVIGAFYTLRAVGDMGDGTLSWLSAFGWAHATRAYVDDRWWPLMLPVTTTALLIAAALALGVRRDVAAGLVRPRAGRAEASDRLTSPTGLALRLQRANLVGWMVALLAFGVVYGTLVGEVERFFEEVAAIEDIIGVIEGATVIDSFLAVILSFLAMLSAIYVALAVLRLRTEETTGRAEPVLATAVAQERWAASHLAVAMVGGALLLLVATLGFAVSAAITLGDAGKVPALMASAIAYVPALWVVAGVGIALFGFVPRASGLVLVVVVYALTIGMLGGLLGLPDWADGLSPFGHVPLLPAADLRMLPLVILTVLAAALVGGGVAAFRRRDLETT